MLLGGQQSRRSRCPCLLVYMCWAFFRNTADCPSLLLKHSLPPSPSSPIGARHVKNPSASHPAILLSESKDLEFFEDFCRFCAWSIWAFSVDDVGSHLAIILVSSTCSCIEREIVFSPEVLALGGVTDCSTLSGCVFSCCSCHNWSREYQGRSTPAELVRHAYNGVRQSLKVLVVVLLRKWSSLARVIKSPSTLPWEWP